MNRVSASPSVGKPTFWSIQYLRGLAAIAVVVFHATTGELMPPGSAGFTLGAHGVDVFFVISGFIMFTAARDEPVLRFLLTRAVRIFPLYWFALALQVLWTLSATDYGISGRELLASALLWPFYSFGHPDKIWPILVPGWTLSYEMLFYAIFAIGIIARRVILVPITILLLLVGLGWAIEPHAAPLVVATNPLLIEFVIGLLLGVAVERGLLTFASLSLVWGVSLAIIWTLTLKKPLIMAGAGGLVALALISESTLEKWPTKVLRVFGDASYSIYLFHTIFLGLFHETILALKFGLNIFLQWTIISIDIVLAIAVGVALHLLVERPLLKRLRPIASAVATRFARTGGAGLT